MPTGDWGRPAHTKRRRGALGFDIEGGFSNPPPPPPSLDVRRSPLARVRGRLAGALAELVLALIVVGSVAATMSGSANDSAVSQKRATNSDAAIGWSGRAQTLLTALVDDLASVDLATRAAGIGRQLALDSARRALVADDTRADGLGPPPGSLRGPWRSTVRQVDAVRATIVGLSPNPSTLDLTQLRAEEEAAATSIANFVSLTEATGS